MPDKILVVDDEAEIADLIEVYLQNEGYTVTSSIQLMMPLPALTQWSLTLHYWM